MAEPTKRCARCREPKPWSDFHAKVKWPDGTMRQPHSRCKRCQNSAVTARQAKWRREHPEEARAFDKARWARLKANPERLAVKHDVDRRSMAAQRRASGIAPRRYRGKRDNATLRGDFLPAAPLASFLSEYVARVGGIEQAAWAMGYKADKTLRSILHGQEFVTERVADQMLQAAGEMTLGDLYPEWREGRVAA